MSNIGIKSWLIGFLLISLVGAAGYALTRQRLKSLSIKSASLPIKYVRTEGEFQYLSKDDVKDILQPLVMTSFFDADMQAIHLAVSDSWVQLRATSWIDEDISSRAAATVVEDWLISVAEMVMDFELMASSSPAAATV